MPWWTPVEQHVARITHRCTLCTRTIEPGERYSKNRGYDAGDAWTWKECRHCTAMIRIYDLYELADGEGLDVDTVLDWSTDRSDTVAEAKAKYGFRNAWRYHGSRLSVPA